MKLKYFFRKIVFTAAAVLLGVSVITTPVLAAPQKMPDGGTFDADYYAQNNPDVVNALGTTDLATLYIHYQNYGKAEGRQPYAPGTNAANSSSAAAASTPYGCTYLRTESGYPVYLVTGDGLYYTANISSAPSLMTASESAGVPYTLAADANTDVIGVFGKLNYYSSDGKTTITNYPLATYVFPTSSLVIATANSKSTTLPPAALVAFSNSAPAGLIFGMLNGQLWLFDMSWIK